MAGRMGGNSVTVQNLKVSNMKDGDNEMKSILTIGDRL